MKVTGSTSRLVTGFIVLSLMAAAIPFPAWAAANPQGSARPAFSASVDESHQPGALIAQINNDLPSLFAIDKSHITGVAHESALPGDKPEHEVMRHLLVVLAYSKDPILCKLLKKKDYANVMLLAGTLGVFGVTMADHIYVEHEIYNNRLLIPKTFESVKIRQLTVANLTVIYDSITVATALLVTSWNLYYASKIKKRKKQIDAQIDRVIDDLNHGANNVYARNSLMALLKNDEAVTEYLNIWHYAHTGAPPTEQPQTDVNTLFKPSLKRYQF